MTELHRQDLEGYYSYILGMIPGAIDPSNEESHRGDGEDAS